ncbi:hypothetical protein V6N13_009023 [Hibiscus sabdariffa]
MFDPFERVARAHHVCPCCERPFSAEEEDEFVKKQRVKAASSAEHMKVLAVESSNAESYFQQLDKLRMALSRNSGVLQAEVEDLASKFDIGGQGGARNCGRDPIGAKQFASRTTFLLFAIRDALYNAVEDLRAEQRYMEKDLQSIQVRCARYKEKKVEVANTLRDFKKAEEEIEHLSEERRQLDLEEKHLAESLNSVVKEKESLLNDYDCLKVKLDEDYEQQQELRRSNRHEAEELYEINRKD